MQVWIKDSCWDDYTDDEYFHVRVGTHTLRKTAYHFAVYGVLYKYQRSGRRNCQIRQSNEKNGSVNGG